MKVTLINQPSIASMYAAAQVCRNSSNPMKALEGALKAGHSSLLEHMNFSFKISGVSRALTHQLVRHRIASFAQESQRHCTININSIEWYVAPGTAVPLFHTTMQVIGASYLQCIKDGMPPEDARYLLPNGAMTKIVVTMNARALDNFFKLRCCDRAQWEIRDLAKQMLKICKTQSIYFKDKVYPDCKHCLEPCK